MPPMLTMLTMLPLPGSRQPRSSPLDGAENNVRRMISALLRSEKLQYILIGSEYSETSKRYPH